MSKLTYGKWRFKIFWINLESAFFRVTLQKKTIFSRKYLFWTKFFFFPEIFKYYCTEIQLFVKKRSKKAATSIVSQSRALPNLGFDLKKFR